ncbi:MAG: hypothetical protein H6704_30990 [Myxococcales bacterium]|nr:hypothetical protein [Myxococcales bacterium]
MSTTDAPLPGWTLTTAETLAEATPADTEARRAFFLGGHPDWPIAIDPELPKRGFVGQLVEALGAAAAEGIGTASVVVGRGGAGKTTALLQVGAALARDHGWRIFTRPDPLTGIDAVQAAQIEGPALLLMDSIDVDLAPLADVCRLLSLAENTTVHVLSAAREGDWKRAARGWRRQHRDQPLDQPGRPLQILSLGAPDAAEATSIVDAWKAAGEVPGAEEAVTALTGGAAVLDASLAAHLNVEGMQAHAAALLAGLEGAPQGALPAIAAAEAADFGGVHPRVLADLAGVPLDDLWTAVVDPLRAVGAADIAGGNVVTRHPRLATALIEGAEPDIDLVSLYLRLVEQVVETGRGVRLGGVHGRTLGAARNLADGLPSGLDPERRKAIAEAVAPVVPDRKDKAPPAPASAAAADDAGEGGPKKKRRNRRKKKGPHRTLFTYTVKADRVAENEALLKAVHAHLAAKGDPDLRFAAFRTGDRTFVHLISVSGPEQAAALDESPVYRAFLETLPDRCDGRPTTQPLRAVETLNFD